MDAVAASGGVFLGPIAMIPTGAAWVCAATPTIEVEVSLQGQTDPVRRHACVVDRLAVNGVADAGVHLMVFDPRRAQAEAHERAAAQVRMERALEQLRARLNGPKLKKLDDARRRLDTLRSRHGLAARFLRTELDVQEGVSVLRWTCDAEVLTARAQQDGRWPPVTNRAGLTDADLCVWAVRRYKTHGWIERDQRLLEGPLRLRPLFVHDDERVRALVAVCAWALMAWTPVDRQARCTLAPPAKKREVARPWARRVVSGVH